MSICYRMQCVLCKLCCHAGTVFANSDRYWERHNKEWERSGLTYYHLQLLHEQYADYGHMAFWWLQLQTHRSFIVSVSTTDSSTEDMMPYPFRVLNKYCNPSVFISVSQWWGEKIMRMTEKWVYESLNQLWPECVRFKHHFVYWMRNGA